MFLLSQPMIMKPVESIKTPPIPPKKYYFFLSKTLILLETHSMSLNKLRYIVKGQGSLVCYKGATESQTQLGDLTTTTFQTSSGCILNPHMQLKNGLAVSE